MDSPVWNDPYYLKLWIYCLMKATHKKRKVLLGNTPVELTNGQFVTGRKSLAEELNDGLDKHKCLSEKTWYRYLEVLESLEMLTIKKTNKYSVISITNWCQYQDSDQQVSSNCPTDVQQLSTNKNVKNDKNVKNNTSRSKLKFETIHLDMANRFYNNILKNNPDYKKPNIENWANEIRLMMERDNRTEEQIIYLIDWVQNDDFEMTNVLSPSKLRKRFDQLVMKVKKEKGSTNKKQEKDYAVYRDDNVELDEDDFY